MPVYKGRKAGTHRVVIWARGRSHERIVTGTKREAELYEARKRVEFEARGTVDVRVAPTFFDFADNHYRPWAETHLAASTWRKVRKYQVATLRSFFGPLKLSELRAASIDEYKRLRLEDGTGATAINNELRVLRAMLNWGREERRLPIPEIRIRPLPSRGTRRVHVWTLVEVRRLYQSAKAEAPWLVPMLVLLVNTGLRKGELLAADWSWVDLRARLLRIPVSDTWSPKSRRAREVPLSDAALSTLRSLPKKGPWLFTSKLGQRYSSFPEAAFDRVTKAAGLTGGPHTTRHTFASLFLHAKPDLFALSKILGHSHTKTTELYSHLLPGHLQASRNVVNLAPTVARTMAAPRKKQAK